MVVYLVTNQINGKQYVGQTKRTIEERWYDHCKKDGCTALHNAILKYGESNFNIKVIDTANTSEELNQKEAHWVDKLNTLSPNGYNLRTGGDRFELSSASKQKVSNTLKERWENGTLKATWTRKVCQYTKTGELIKIWDSIRKAGKELGIQDKHIPDACSGKRITVGGFAWRYYEDTFGAPITVPKRKRNPDSWFNSHCKPILQFDLDGKFIKQWNSTLEAANELGISNGYICDACKGRRKSAKGYIWQYANTQGTG